LRIAIVSDCYPPRLGGIEVQAHDLAQRLLEAGHEVVVVTTTPGPDRVDGVRVVRIDTHLPVDVPVIPSVFDDVLDALIAERVDVAHYHGGILSPLAFKGAADAQSNGIPTVVTTHCLWSYATPAFRLLEHRYRWAQWPVVLSAVSDVAAEPIRRIAGGRSSVTILPNGIDVDTWRVEPSPRDPAVFTVVAVQRLAPRKRPLHLLRILRQVRDRLAQAGGPQLRVLLIGDGGERGRLERYVRTHGLGDVVELTGRWSREQIRACYAEEADVFVAPANLESFGIAPLEARTAGVPVVAKARTGVREFVVHGREGLLATDDHDMAEQIIRLGFDRELRSRIAEHNRTVPPPMDWKDVVERNVSAYRQAVALMAGARAPADGGRSRPGADQAGVMSRISPPFDMVISSPPEV
jgi:glycosyltransferase involved in cell wall biosynthesis